MVLSSEITRYKQRMKFIASNTATAGHACKGLCSRLCGSIKRVAYLRKLRRRAQAKTSFAACELKQCINRDFAILNAAEYKLYKM